MEAFAFRHGGFRFAVPHARVRRVLATRPDAELLALAPDGEPDSAGQVFVELDCAGVARFVACAQAGLAEVGAPQQLSRVLAGVLSPHFVGWAELDGDLVWLVDVTRFDAL